MRLEQLTSPGTIPNSQKLRVELLKAINYVQLEGIFAFGGENRQIGLLEADGIEVKDGCVDLSKYQWRKEIF